MDTVKLLAAQAAAVRAGAAPSSPCLSVCRMSSNRGLCEGCWLTLDEISQWSRADETAKRAIWNAIEQRLNAFTT